ncbi:DUF3566 domain-containing protein [Nocardioides sp. GXZ039]|uniref:DUF3566 domain-containing protein n=1 Tax=Nocardioides sp. GXZ039 TaxID=3136018 RepID=UPI0030F378DB
MSDRQAPTTPPPKSPPKSQSKSQQRPSQRKPGSSGGSTGSTKPPSTPPSGSAPVSSGANRPSGSSTQPPKPPKAPKTQKTQRSTPAPALAKQPTQSSGTAPAAPATPPPAAGDPGDTAVRPGFADRIAARFSGSDRRTDGADSTSPAAAPAVAPAAAAAAAPSSTPKPKPRGPRRARLRLTRIDPWSVMKTAFLLSIAFGIVTVVAVAVIWEVIGAAGVWGSINDTVKEVINEPGTKDFDIQDYVGTNRVLGFTMLVAAVDVILITAIATLGAFLYNLSAALLGGVEVTLAEDN